MVACNVERIIIKLDAPYGFSVDGNILTWNNISNANEYIVRVGDTEYTVTTNSFDLSRIPAGINRVQVRAKEHETDSHTFQQSDFGEVLHIRKMAQTTQISFGFNQLNWSAVAGASGYIVNIFDSREEVVFSRMQVGTWIQFSQFSNLLSTSPSSYTVSVVATAPAGANTIFEETVIFTSINSDTRTVSFVTSNDIPAPSGLTLNNSESRIEWNRNELPAGNRIIIRDPAKNIIYQSDIMNAWANNFVRLEQFADKLTVSGVYEISVIALVSNEPVWVLAENRAVWTTLNSQQTTLEFTVDLDKQLSSVERIRFSGQTSFITSLVWDSVIGAQGYKVEIFDGGGSRVFEDTMTTTGAFLNDPFHPITRSLVSTGQHTVVVRALHRSDEQLFMHNNQVVRFTQNSEIAEFQFMVNAQAQSREVHNLRINASGNRIEWAVQSFGDGVFPAGFIMEIYCDNGEIVYSHRQNIGVGNNNFINVNSFANRLGESGIYTFAIRTVASPHITLISNVGMPKDSVIVEIQFSFDSNADIISLIS